MVILLSTMIIVCLWILASAPLFCGLEPGSTISDYLALFVNLLLNKESLTCGLKLLRIGLFPLTVKFWLLTNPKLKFSEVCIIVALVLVVGSYHDPDFTLHILLS